MLWEKMEDGRVHCFLCAHHCKIDEGKFGFCGNRKNEGGALYTYAYGEVIASHVDPIEKKPLYHFLPGSYAYSIATVGCNFRCSFCQNWDISQAPHEAKEKEPDRWKDYFANLVKKCPDLSPEDAVKAAEEENCKTIAFTYNEPTIFTEYALDIMEIAKSGIFTTPAVVVDGEVKCVGRIPEKEEIKSWLI